MLITVLYEDQRAQPNNYGPHSLLLACLADRTEQSHAHLKSLVGCMPKKGNGSVKVAIERDFAKLRDDGPVLAIFDEDKVRDCYNLAAQACKREVLAAILGAPARDMQVVLLIRNVEDLLRACCVALAIDVPEGKPTPSDRDSILHRAAWADCSVREHVLQHCPSFARAVASVEMHLSGSPPSQRPTPNA